MGIGKKMTKGIIGGGVNVPHKGPKMSGKAKSLMSYPGGMPGPGEYGSMNNKVVGKGMMKYMAGEPVGMGKYKTNAQRKAAHASMAEQGAAKYGKHMGPEKAKTMVKGPDGKMVPDYAVDGKGSGDLKKSSPGKYGHKKGPNKHGKHKGPAMPFGKGANVENKKETRLDKTKKKAKDAKEDANNKVKKLNKTQAEVDSMKISKAKADRLAKRQKRQEGRAERKTIRKNKDLSRGDKRKQIIDSREKQNKKGPSKTVELDNVTVTGDKNLVGANDTKVLKHLKKSGRDAKNINEALKKYGKNRVYQSAKSSGGDYALFQGQYGKQ